MSMTEGVPRPAARGGETVTVSTKKVLTAAIEHVRKAVKEAPECSAKEVPKQQAIQALVPEIHEMQSKGYGWEAIASFLSDHGVAINVVTLKSYLRRAKAGGVRPEGKRRGGKEAKERTPRRSGRDTGVGTREAEKIRAGGKMAPASTATARPGKEAAEAAPKAASAPAKDGAKPWSFVPEEDTDDI
jgi:hypothetical protein